mmetsp:Transcript_8603/g.12688  ORF Transcript_8603/g.12688 Transcript_8603/m.12688 type:complete len:237 (-) Transcript_8603:329-1039(-)
MCLAMMISLFPVVVTNTSTRSTTFSRVSTWYPAISACSAQIGSISPTITLHPWDLSDSQHPFPTSPYPATNAVFPANMTSVALMIPSTSECLHPYTLSNLDLVTQSFTFTPGNFNFPVFAISINRCTPVVVSSDTPLMCGTTLCQYPGWLFWIFFSKAFTHFNSSLSVGSSKIDGSSSASNPLWISNVASPPSSTIICGPSVSENLSASHVQFQYSSRVSPFHANTGVCFAIAAAA